MSYKKFLVFLPMIGLFFVVGQPALAQLQMPSTSNSGVEAEVEAAFVNVPQMVAVARCESGFREFNAGGTVLMGGTGGNYVGIFQISTGHIAEAQNLDFDIYTVDGNIGYAKYMYEQEGIQPWISCAPSSSATPVVVASAPATTLDSTTTTPALSPTAPIISSAMLTQTLSEGMVSPQVQVLQQILNSSGFPVAASGPGSPGNETTKFGALTLQAVQKFQCSQNIVCSGSPSTTGYGLVGPHTRAALSAIAK